MGSVRVCVYVCNATEDVCVGVQQVHEEELEGCFLELGFRL